VLECIVRLVLLLLIIDRANKLKQRVAVKFLSASVNIFAEPLKLCTEGKLDECDDMVQTSGRMGVVVSIVLYLLGIRLLEKWVVGLKGRFLPLKLTLL
jgi:hypothetical protein